MKKLQSSVCINDTFAIMRFFWPVFALCTLILREVFRKHPDWTEKIYSRGIFQGIRYLIDALTGWLPFPLTYILLGLLFWQLFVGIRFLFFARQLVFIRRLARSGWRLLTFLCAIIGVFYWIWGFNYSRIPIEQHLCLPDIKLTTADIKTALDTQTRTVLRLRAQIQADSSQPLTNEIPFRTLEQRVRKDVAHTLRQIGYPTPGRIRGRQPFWNGLLLRFGAIGIYNPFSGESNIDPGIHFLTKPIHLAHEFSHGYGFGDEGTCNFLAYIALQQSDQLPLRYAAELDFWRDLAIAYRGAQPEAYLAFRQTLPAGFRADLDAINQKIAQYPEFFAAFRYQVYDHYLKTQGISEGILNYDKVIPMVLAYRERGRR